MISGAIRANGMMLLSYYPEKVRELQALAEEARKDLGDDSHKFPGANRRKAGSTQMN